MSALAEVRQRSSHWLYLRLFYTEVFLGWDKQLDHWYTHPIFEYASALIIAYALAIVLRVRLRHRVPHRDHSVLSMVAFVTVPFFITLLFMIGQNSLAPMNGVQRMDTKGCCTQALVFQRSQVHNLTMMLLDEKPSQTDMRIEKWANEQALERYAIAPQVLQHVGIYSTRGMPKKYARETFAYGFEANSPEQLRRDHRRLARWGVWRAKKERYT